jgi:predicted nucleic acid-binding protein
MSGDKTFGAKAFIDTNVFVYFQQSDDLTKHQISEDTLNFFDCVVSTQVLNEVCNLLTKKFPTPLPDILQFLQDIVVTSELVVVSGGLIIKALRLSEQYCISYYDALMIAAALESNCKYLISEDMQDGLIIENKLTIINIYKHTDMLKRMNEG